MQAIDVVQAVMYWCCMICPDVGELRALAVRYSVDPRSIQRALDGKLVRGMAGKRAIDAARDWLESHPDGGPAHAPDRARDLPEDFGEPTWFRRENLRVQALRSRAVALATEWARGGREVTRTELAAALGVHVHGQDASAIAGALDRAGWERGRGDDYAPPPDLGARDPRPQTPARALLDADRVDAAARAIAARVAIVHCTAVLEEIGMAVDWRTMGWVAARLRDAGWRACRRVRIHGGQRAQVTPYVAC